LIDCVDLLAFQALLDCIRLEVYPVSMSFLSSNPDLFSGPVEHELAAIELPAIRGLNKLSKHWFAGRLLDLVHDFG